MFGFFSGWRKASKCKKLLKRVQCKLKLLKNKRHSIARQLRDDVAQLIRIGYEDIAFNRVEQLFEDENIMAVYELLDGFCEFVIKNMSYIRRNKDCPNDVNEAVSSLIFASARFGDLPELRVIRNFFRERYGQSFETTALELLPGNLVNFQVKERMSVQSVPDDVKLSLVDEIARDYRLCDEIMALEFIPEEEQQVTERNEFGTSGNNVRADSSRIEESQIELSSANDTGGKAIYIDLASTCRSSTLRSQQEQSYDVINTSVSPSAGPFLSTDIMDSPLYEKEAEVHNRVGMGSEHRLEDSAPISPGCKKFQIITASSSESSPHFPDDMIVYLDDVEEVRSSITKDGSFQDQRIFKFRSFVLPKTERIEGLKCADESESWYKIACLSSRDKIMKPDSKRSKRRSMSLESTALKDSNSEIYYNKPSRKPPPHKNRRSCYTDATRNQTPFGQESEHRSYCGSWRDRGDREATHSHQQRYNCKSFHNCRSSGSEESDTEMEWYTFTQQPKRINGNQKQTEKSVSEVLGAKQAYVRATTMPQDRSKESEIENILRSHSFPVQSPRHVHPNLPDYDDIAAKFQALKQEHLRSKCNVI